jgi:UDP-3-O-[3-hydroxymyristoyl] glucosamine N-acyltransferase
LKNINNITFADIKKCLLLNDVDYKTNLLDTDEFTNIRSLHESNKNELTFAINSISSKLLSSTNAKACFVNKHNSLYLPDITSPIIVDDPYKAFALLSNIFKAKELSNGEINKYVTISNEVKLSSNIQIDSFVNIYKNCEIHENVIIGSNCSIGPNVIIGKDCIIKPNTILQNCIIGKSCYIKSGANIGGTGFGFDPKNKIKIQHFGNVIIKNNSSIGSNTTIDRAVFNSTIISENSFIDNLVQIAHNVVIGRDAIIAAQTGIAGSTIIGDNVLIGGQAGISGHLTIGKNVKIAAKSGVTKNIKNNSTVAGFPAVDIKKWKISNIKLNKL